MVDPTSAKLAQDGLAVYSEGLLPLYDELRTRLIGELASASAEHEDLILAEERSQSNRALLDGFMQLLPTGAGDWIGHGTIIAADAYQLRLLEMNLLWVEGGAKYSSRTSPYYIVGQEPDGDTSNLLLYAGLKKPDGQQTLITGKVNNNEFSAAQEIAREGAYREYTDAEIRARFDAATKGLRVRQVRNSMKTSNPTYSIHPTLRKHRRDMRKFLGSKGMTIVTGRAITSGLTDSQLARYDVFSHLNHFATVFGLAGNLAALFQNYGSEKPDTAQQKLFEEKAEAPDEFA